MAMMVPLDCMARETAAEKPAKVVVVPVRAQIAKPELFILRRGLKQAIEEGADTLVLDMETPGGALDVTFEMLKALEKFDGKTITFVNREAISAGALIAAGTDEIHFAPEGVIGAAAPVLATGGEIDETMRSKIVSYLKARVRSISEGKGYRGEVISAMIDTESEFKIGDTVLKPKGELLSLTAQEALKEYGDPPQPLLGAGISKNLTELLDAEHGVGRYQITNLEVTWSEQVAQYLTMLTPVLLGLGLLGMFIEFKTPGFGIFGIAGLLLLALVFFGHHLAGLSGNEVILFFLLGVVLLAVEVFFFPGSFVIGIAGLALMLGSLVWAMLDHWPNETPQISGDALFKPLANVMSGILLAALGFLAVLKFLPKGGPFGKLVLNTAVGGTPTLRPVHGSAGGATPSMIGHTGVALTALMPSGQVEIAGKRYEAQIEVGSVAQGQAVRVLRASPFGLIVEVLS
jgi:membrane-bound serine protease (ClpP class)